MKERAVLTASGELCVPVGSGLIVRAMGKDASDNPMRVSEVEKLVLNVRVVEKALQQTERRTQSHRKSRKSGRREENLQKMMMSSVHCPVLRGQVPMVQLCKKTVEFPMVEKIQGLVE